MTTHDLLVFIYGGAIIISILTLVTIAKHLKRRNDGNGSDDIRDICDNGINGES